MLVRKMIAVSVALLTVPASAGDCRRAVSHAVVTHHAEYVAPVYSQAYYTVDGDGRARQIDKLLDSRS